MFSIVDLLTKHIFARKQRSLTTTNTIPAGSETTFCINKYLNLIPNG